MPYIALIRGGSLTVTAALKRCMIPRSTLINKLQRNHTNKFGRPMVFTEAEEKSFVGHIIKFCVYGFPLGEIDLRHVIKFHLDGKKENLERFKNNFSDKKWSENFFKRH